MPFLKCFTQMTCRTRASHHRHRPYLYKQDIDVSSRGGCVISVLSCLCAYQNRPKITMTVTTPNGSGSSTGEMVCAHPRDLFIPDLSIGYLSGCQKSASHCSRRTDRPNFTRGFLIASFKSNVLRRRVVLLSAGPNQRFCAVR
jgi:hypothetical protein